MRHLGIDYGTKRVGLALSDEAGAMGFPYKVVPNDRDLKTFIVDLIKKEHVAVLVMGESLNFQGEENPVAREARAFATDVGQEAGIPIVYEPEMLTTQEARRDFEGIRTHGVVDSSAAALILTSYLSRNHD